MIRRLNTAEKFWSLVDKTSSSGCWLWTKYRNKLGYGSFYWQGKLQGAHRVSWRIAHGDIPPGLLVLHRCDNPPCVRPDHLFLGTDADNSNDMVTKGRVARGERNANSKLKPTDVRSIRREYAAGGVTMSDLARRYGVAQSGIVRIINRKMWAHVPDDDNDVQLTQSRSAHG